MMNNKFNNSLKYFLSFLIAGMMIFAFVAPAFATKEYKISFKAGSKGVYTDSSTSKNEMVVANGDLQVAPDTLVASLNVEDGYYFNGWNYTVKQTAINKSANYVAQYKRIVNEAVYRVSYIDTYGNELATQKVVTSNTGIVVAENAINIEGYAVDQLTKTVKVEKEGTEIIFTYVSTASGEVETIIQNEVVVVAGGTGTAPGGPGGNVGTTDGTTGAGDNNTAGGTGGIGTEEVEEPETPLAGNDDKNANDSDSNYTYLFVGGLLAIVVIVGVVYIIKKKKQA